MKIYFLDKSKGKMSFMKRYFQGEKDMEFICEDLETFLANTPVECVVSPANSFGLMDGGYDFYITKYFGEQLQTRVQEYIIKHYNGEQPLGTSFLIKANDKGQSLIHTPTMQTPRVIKDKFIIYQCMRSTLMCAKKHKVKSIVIPLFGCGIGSVHPQIVAEMMSRAYDQLKTTPKTLDWKYAFETEIR